MGEIGRISRLPGYIVETGKVMMREATEPWFAAVCGTCFGFNKNPSVMYQIDCGLPVILNVRISSRSWWLSRFCGHDHMFTILQKRDLNRGQRTVRWRSSTHTVDIWSIPGISGKYRKYLVNTGKSVKYAGICSKYRGCVSKYRGYLVNTGDMW